MVEFCGTTENGSKRSWFSSSSSDRRNTSTVVVMALITLRSLSTTIIQCHPNTSPSAESVLRYSRCAHRGQGQYAEGSYGKKTELSVSSFTILTFCVFCYKIKIHTTCNKDIQVVIHIIIYYCIQNKEIDMHKK